MSWSLPCSIHAMLSKVHAIFFFLLCLSYRLEIFQRLFTCRAPITTYYILKKAPISQLRKTPCQD